MPAYKRTPPGSADIINGRGRNEKTDNLKYWKSVGIPSKGGVISDEDFTRWEPWLVDSGILTTGDSYRAALFNS